MKEWMIVDIDRTSQVFMIDDSTDNDVIIVDSDTIVNRQNSKKNSNTDQNSGDERHDDTNLLSL
jgi:hypothetical protein